MSTTCPSQFCVTFSNCVIEAFGVQRDTAWYPEYALTKSDRTRGPVKRPEVKGFPTVDMAVQSALRFAIDDISLDLH